MFFEKNSLLKIFSFLKSNIISVEVAIVLLQYIDKNGFYLLDPSQPPAMD
jgi:hypothetical protein